MTIDAFTSASPTFRRAQSLGSRPMALAFGEVAVFKRKPPSILAKCAGALAFFIFVAALIAVRG